MEDNQLGEITPQKKNLLPIILVGVVVLAIIGYVFLRNGGERSLENSEDAEVTDKLEETSEISPSNSIEPTDEVKSTSEAGANSFNITGSNFSFSTTELKVKKGEKVKIIFQSKGGLHDWTVDEFNAKTRQIKDGESAEVEFVADKAGTFEYYCSVGQHRTMGMKGKLIVE